MASVQRRETKSGPRWRVMWWENGKLEQQTFAGENGERFAARFKRMVEAAADDMRRNSSGHWPPQWDKVHGCLIDEAPSDSPTFEDYARKTLDARTRIAEGTRRDYLSQLTRHVFPDFGAIPLDELDRHYLAKLSRQLVAKGLAAKTRANIHGLVSSILKDAKDDELIKRNPAIGVLRDVPTVRSETMVFLTPPEFAMLVNHIPEHYQPLIRFLAGTGTRWGEATALQVRDVELFGRPVVHIRRAWKNHEYRVLGEPKTARSRRTLSLSSVLVDLLAPLVINEPDTFVFTNKFGRPINHGDFYRNIWQTAVTAAQADGLTKRPRIHDCRHTHVAWLIAAGVPLPAIQARLGHESIRTTIDRYGHLLPELDTAINTAVDKELLPIPD